MKCEMYTGNNKEGVPGKGSRSEGCRGAKHGQTRKKDRSRAGELGEATKLREVNRQATTAYVTKCRNSLQVCSHSTISRIFIKG
jgi:hypothetical protein